jgi:membrane carboxypeptidase/penicillin-binding protein PbpC
MGGKRRHCLPPFRNVTAVKRIDAQLLQTKIDSEDGRFRRLEGVEMLPGVRVGHV